MWLLADHYLINVSGDDPHLRLPKFLGGAGRWSPLSIVGLMISGVNTTTGL